MVPGLVASSGYLPSDAPNTSRRRRCVKIQDLEDTKTVHGPVPVAYLFCETVDSGRA